MPMLQTGITTIDLPDDNSEGVLGSDKVNMAPPLLFVSHMSASSHWLSNYLLLTKHPQHAGSLKLR